MILIRRDIPGIIGTGYADNRMEVKLSGSRLISFYNIPEDCHLKLLSIDNPLEYLEQLKHSYRHVDHGCILG